MKCLVTGGAGFIGSNIVEGLVEAGHAVTVLDDFSLGSRENLAKVVKDIQIVENSVEDSGLVKKISKGVDCIFSEAAISSSVLIQTREDWERAFQVNVNGLINILDAARENDIKRVIYASSSVVYGNGSLPFKELAKPLPLNLYAVAHLAQESVAGIYSREYGIETVGLRYMSVYGPHEKSKRDRANVVSQFLWSMRQGEQPEVYGDGTQMRDFVYVKDVSRANLLAMKFDKKLRGEVFNVGTGKMTSFNELIKVLNGVLGTDISGKYVENPIKNYMVRQPADVGKIKKVLGFRPKYDLKKGILATISASQL